MKFKVGDRVRSWVGASDLGKWVFGTITITQNKKSGPWYEIYWDDVGPGYGSAENCQHLCEPNDVLKEIL